MQNKTFQDPFLGSVIVEEGVDFDSIDMEALRNNPEIAQVVRWGSSINRNTSIFERDKYVNPSSIFDQMAIAQDASESDDTVAGVLEATEALAFSKMSFECDEDDEEDIWNQIARDLDLDSRLREMWRELFTVSQFYAVTWWGTKTYKVSGRTKDGTKRKKTYSNLKVPVSISILDPLKVVPVGNIMFNREQLCYVTTDKTEISNIYKVLNGDNESSDAIIKTIMISPYEPDMTEKKLLSQLNIATGQLFILNPKNVWRHTATRPQYKRFAEVRLRSVFELLDLKRQLHEMDRTHLLGGTNFITLIKKGTDQLPAKQSEINSLQANIRTLARVPVIVGDHRLSVEIVTPSNDNTLDKPRYDVLDQKIAARLYQSFVAMDTRDDSIKLGRVVARGMESRRHLLARALEKNIVRPTVSVNMELQSDPKLVFHPKQIALDFDPGLATFMFDLRDRGDLSRETILSQIDLDQTDEARKREREAELYDETFQTAVPFNSPVNNPIKPTDKQGNGGGGSDTRAAGRTGGGNRSGGGAAPGTGQGQEPRNPRKTSK